MSKLGIDRVGQLAAMPRAPMVRRFGKDAALRLDQAMGHAFEPINPLIPEETALATLAFAEPIGKLEALKDVVRRLSDDLCRELVRRGQGVRRLDLILRRVDQKGASLRAGTAKATRDIPSPTDQNPWAQWRKPMDMTRQGCSVSLFQASQQHGELPPCRHTRPDAP
jgi:protein ImuB